MEAATSQVLTGTEGLGFNLVEAIADGFVAINRDWRYIYINAAAESVSRFTKEELLGNVIWDVFPELVGGEIEALLRRAMEERQPGTFEYYHPKRDVWLNLRAFPTPYGVAVLFIDVTRDKLKTIARATEAEFAKSLADEMPQIAWSTTAEGEIDFVNSRWYEYTGVEPGLPSSDYAAVIHPDDVERTAEQWSRCLQTGEPFEAELRIRDRDGIFRWHLSRNVAVRNEQGQISRWFGTSTDIHNQKLAEEALGRNMQRFEMAFSSGNFVTYEQDVDLRYTWLFPLKHYYRDRIGKSDRELLPPDQAEVLVELKSRVLRTGVGERQVVHAFTRGAVHAFDLLVEPIKEPDGTISGVSGAAIDVTDRMRAEEALRDSEERFRAAIENSPIPKIIHSEDGEIIYASRAWWSATNHQPGSATTVREWVGLVGERDSKLENSLRSAFEQERSGFEEEFEHTLCGSDEREHIWILTSAPLGVLPDGRRLAVTAAIDITERKYVEEGQRYLTLASRALAESLDYDRTLHTVSQLAVPNLANWCAVDLLEEDGTIRRVAVAHQDPEKVKWAHEIQEKYPPQPDAPTGVPAVLRTGKPELWSTIPDEVLNSPEVTDEQREIVREAELKSFIIVPLVSRGKAIGAITLVSPIPGRFQERDLPIFEELGRIAGLAVDNSQLYSSMVAELEERKRVEEEVRMLNESLNERVRSRTAELEAANREMEGFTYSVSHDLRAPLRAIIANSMILLDDVRDKLDEEQVDMLKRQAHAAKRMGVLIDELLQLSRISRQAMVREPVDLSEIAEDIAEDLKSDGRADGIRFEIERNLVAHGDSRLLRFVILNLLENAVKFSPQGGTITVGKEDGSFFVRDQGIGFDMQYQHKLFQPFERLVNDSDYPGTGIGLANVQRIVQRHGGDVHAVGEPGKGATFYFSL